MNSLFYRLVFSFIHLTVDVAVYRLPRALHILFIRWPLSMVEVMGSVPVEARTHASGQDRRIRIITAPFSNPTGTREGLAEAEAAQGRNNAFLSSFGLPTDGAARERQGVRRGVIAESYEGPLYPGHVHTILGAFRPLPPSPARHREVVQSYDGCRVCLDFFFPELASPPSAFVVMLPGLTGSSKEFYIQRMLRTLLPMNVAVAVLNARGVADTPLDTPQIFSAIFTQDIRYVLQHHLTRDLIIERIGSTGPVPVVAMAFSLGGLILTNFVSEQGEAGLPSGLDAAVTVCTPHKVLDCDVAIRQPVSQLLYGPSTSGGLRAYYHRHKEMLEKLPGVDAALVFGTDPAHPNRKPLIERMKSVYEFDNYVTGPHFGFDCATDYYNYANNFRRLGHSQTPQVCIVTRDDPFCGPVQSRREWETVALAHKAGLACVEMPVGGHMGFLGDVVDEAAGQASEMERLVGHMVKNVIQTWYAQPVDVRNGKPSCPKGAVVPRDTPVA